ncbi:Mov34/MPN/PAD-1 family protein [Aeromonas hydrophila]|uniref:Mov34/MPN/PAD-1 family protein n=1 Tax=Aeromonas hydrophila TaxID=644 RepID=UPI002B49A0FD|nr:Mov34/MPN/PAD-1 family protein [Aeromonas hydrophila]
MKCNDEFKTFLPDGLDGMYVHIPKRIIELLSKYKQQPSMNESGGMLFAGINNNSLYILAATEPSHEDKSHRFGIAMNKKKMQDKINEMYYKHNLHYVGDWHTHPEEKPTPSYQDLSTAKGFLNNQKSLNYFVMIIVSCTSFDDSYLGLCGKSREHRLNVQK